MVKMIRITRGMVTYKFGIGWAQVPHAGLLELTDIESQQLAPLGWTEKTYNFQFRK